MMKSIEQDFWVSDINQPKDTFGLNYRTQTTIEFKQIAHNTKKGRNIRMTQGQIKEHISKVHARHYNWETKGTAFDYAQDLWDAAHQCIEHKDTADNTELAKQTHDILHSTGSLAKCLTDNFRKLVILHHVRGLTTSRTIDFILPDETLRDVTPFHVFKFANVCGYDNIKNFLLMRVSYLKPTDPRWPDKKYGAYWEQERRAYLDTINDIPLTHIKEQINALFEHYQTLETHFRTAFESKEIERLHKAKLQTIAAINILTGNSGTNLKQEITPKNVTQNLLNGITTNQKQITTNQGQDLSRK